MVDKSPTEMTMSICESCGQSFGCGARLDGCWCTEIKLTEKQTASIRERYTDCLCTTCLEKYASAEKTENHL